MALQACYISHSCHWCCIAVPTAHTHTDTLTMLPSGEPVSSKLGPSQPQLQGAAPGEAPSKEERAAIADLHELPEGLPKGARSAEVGGRATAAAQARTAVAERADIHSGSLPCLQPHLACVCPLPWHAWHLSMQGAAAAWAQTSAPLAPAC